METPQHEDHSSERRTGRDRREVPRTITPLSVPALQRTGALSFPLRQDALTALVKSALDEDNAWNDLTTIATVVTDRRARAALWRDSRA